MSPPALAIARAPIYAPRDKGWLKSPIEGVRDSVWSNFVHLLVEQPLSAVSDANGQGMFAHRPRRLCDLGIMVNPRSTKLESGRVLWLADYTPLCTGFLRDPLAQYEALVASCKDYVKKIESNEIEPPEDMVLSGALAVLHRGGPGALSKRFSKSKTDILYQKTKELF